MTFLCSFLSSLEQERKGVLLVSACEFTLREGRWRQDEESLAELLLPKGSLLTCVRGKREFYHFPIDFPID